MKTALIGAGVICEQHLLGLRQVTDAQVVGVCDLSEAMARYTAERFGVEAFFTDYQQMLAQTRPDVVHILTPAHTHVRLVSDCLQAHAHVLVEKPIAPTHGEFRDLWDQAQRSRRLLMEDHNYRFNAPVQRIERLVHDNVLGDVQDVEVRMALNIRGGGRMADRNLPHPSHRMPAGALHEFITHLCYLALHFLPGARGASFDRVAAMWSNHGRRGDDDVFTVDDLDALVVMGSGHARIRFSAATGPDCFALTVRGRKGYAAADLFQPVVQVVCPRRGGKQLSPLINQFAGGWSLIGAGIRNFQRKIMRHTPYEGLHELIRRTYAALRDGAALPVTYQDMDDTSRFVDALVSQRPSA